jgi:hypothetical protein
MDLEDELGEIATLDAPTAVQPKGRILHEVVDGDKGLTARE